MTRRTCALCGHRDASDVTAIDGRTVPACGACLAPPVASGYAAKPAPVRSHRRVPRTLVGAAMEAIDPMARLRDGASMSAIARAAGLSYGAAKRWIDKRREASSC